MRVLVTGAGSGIGQGIAVGLAAQGNQVLVSDLCEEAMESTVEQVRLAGGQAQARVLDVADVKAVMAFADEPIDVLVNNAGLQYVASLESFPAGKWVQLVQVMLSGAALLTKAVLPGMRKRGFGRIVNIGSIHSLVASPYKSAYVAAKHGLLGFSKAVALETADTDITINTICPSYVRTPLVEEQIVALAREYGLSEECVVQEIMLEPMPKKAFISIEELVGVTVFLISDVARNITGQTITIDGGWTAR